MKSFITLKNNKTFKAWVIIFWILVWGIVSLLINKEIYLPSPISTLEAFLKLVVKVEFWKSIFLSIFRVMFGFIISCILGIFIGIICGLNKLFYELFNPLIVSIKSTPVMSFIIIALIWFKSGNVPIFICFLMCFPVIWTNVVEGIRNVDSNLLEMAHIYNVKRYMIIRKIYIPSVIPYISAAITMALGLGWKVTVAAEVLSSPKYSIGKHLYDAKVYLESADLFAWTGVIIILSFGFEFLFKYIFKRLKLVGY